MEDKKISINITTGAIVKVIIIMAVVFFLYLVRDIAMAILLSIVIASGIEPAASWFQKRKIPRILAVVFVYIFAFVFFGIMFYLIIPTVFSEISAFADQLPAYLEKPFEAGTVDKIFANLPDFAREALGTAITKVSDYVRDFSVNFFSIMSAAFGGAVSFFTIIVLSFYLSVQEKGIENFLKIAVPAKYENYSISLWSRWKKKISYWLQGQILLGFIVGVLVYLGLTLMKVEYALTFALLAAIFELIPIFGPILASIPPISVSLMHSPLLGLEVAVLFIIIQQFENHLIYPLVVRKMVGVPSMLVIIALLVGAKLGGFLGVILSAPLAIVIIEILEDIDSRKKQALKSASSI